jgi:hypothetical protein
MLEVVSPMIKQTSIAATSNGYLLFLNNNLYIYKHNMNDKQQINDTRTVTQDKDINSQELLIQGLYTHSVDLFGAYDLAF